MHRQRIAVAYANHYIAEYKTSSVCINLNGNDLTVLYAQCLRICAGSMDMTLCSDYALCDLNLSAWSDDLTCSASPDSLIGAATPIARASVKESST